MLTFTSKIHPACHYGAKGIKAGSNSKMTDKGPGNIYQYHGAGAIENPS